MAMPKNISSHFSNGTENCRFLMNMLIASSALLFFLNLYIGYEVVLQFRKDSWSFLGGLFILFAYVFTLPANIFSVLSIKWVRENRNYKFIVPVILGVTATLAGFIFYNAFEYWMLIVAFSVFLFISIFLCKRKKIAKSNYFGDKTNEKTAIDSKLYSYEKINTETNSDTSLGLYKKIKAFQLAGIILISFFALGMLFTPDISLLGMVIFFVVFGLHVFITLFFFKRKMWALRVKLISYYIFLGLTVLVFFSFLITDSISVTNNYFAILFFFVFLLALFVYLIYNYKKLRQSVLFN